MKFEVNNGRAVLYPCTNDESAWLIQLANQIAIAGYDVRGHELKVVIPLLKREDTATVKTSGIHQL